jgi:hypothetical protein
MGPFYQVRVRDNLFGEERTVPVPYVFGPTPALAQAVAYFMAIVPNGKANAKDAKTLLKQTGSYSASGSVAFYTLERIKR